MNESLAENYVRASRFQVLRRLVVAYVCVGVWLFVSVASAADLASLEESAIQSAVQRVAPSVVRIQTVGGLAKVGQVALGDGPCTGVVVSDDGYLVSSSFNFARQPTTILVELPDGSSKPARLIARDNSRAIVLLKVELGEGGDRLTPAEAAADDSAEVGDWAIAVGRTYEAAEPNVSIGIISAVNRIWGKAVQTDAKISPSNYGGPLVDIHGRVVGVLAPLSPQSTEATAGAKWYDSGIGFAVPLTHIQKVLPRLKKGEDLQPGLMGISLKGRDQFGVAPVIAAAQPGSPAHEAGLKTGDKIAEVNGHAVSNQAQLKHQVSPLYAGDTVQLTVLRGDEQKEFEFELTDKLLPYAHPFLGIVPRRDASDEEGIIVRFVFPKSGAEAAGLQAGDRLISVAGKTVKSTKDLYDSLVSHVPDETIKIIWKRDDKTTEEDATLTGLPVEVPDELPPARDATEPEDVELTVGEFQIKLPEFKNECVAFVPENYDPAIRYGVVIHLPRSGKFDKDGLIAGWKDACAQHDLILLVPQPREAERWQPDEVEFIGRALDHLAQEYEVDPARTVAYGRQAGGAMAFLAFAADESQIHGVAVVDTAMPGGAKPPALEPTSRAAIFWAHASEGRDAGRTNAQIAQLRKMKYPVTVLELDKSGRDLSDSELAKLVRWIDTLDRI